MLRRVSVRREVSRAVALRWEPVAFAEVVYERLGYAKGWLDEGRAYQTVLSPYVYVRRPDRSIIVSDDCWVYRGDQPGSRRQVRRRRHPGARHRRRRDHRGQFGRTILRSVLKKRWVKPSMP